MGTFFLELGVIYPVPERDGPDFEVPGSLVEGILRQQVGADVDGIVKAPSAEPALCKEDRIDLGRRADGLLGGHVASP